MAFTKPVMAAPMPIPTVSVKASTKNDERVIFMRASCFRWSQYLSPFSSLPMPPLHGVPRRAFRRGVGRVGQCSLVLLSDGVGVHPAQKEGAWTPLAVASPRYVLLGGSPEANFTKRPVRVQSSNSPSTTPSI